MDKMHEAVIESGSNVDLHPKNNHLFTIKAIQKYNEEISYALSKHT